MMTLALGPETGLDWWYKLNGKDKPNDVLSVLAINEKSLLSARSIGGKVTLESSDNQLRFPIESFKI